MRKFVIAAALAVVGLLGATSSAEAAFKVRISTDGGTTFTTVEDETAGDTIGGGDVGIISFKYSDALVGFTISTGQSKPVFGNTTSQAIMDIHVTGTFKSTAILGTTVVIDITDTDFGPTATPSSPTGSGTLSVNLGSSAPAGTTLIGYLDNGPDGNHEFGGIAGEPVGSFLLTTPTATAPGTLSTSVTGVASAPYSLTARTVFSFDGIPENAGFSIDNSVKFTSPAPAGLVLALAGMPVFGLGAYVRRRTAKV